MTIFACSQLSERASVPCLTVSRQLNGKKRGGEGGTEMSTQRPAKLCPRSAPSLLLSGALQSLKAIPALTAASGQINRRDV